MNSCRSGTKVPKNYGRKRKSYCEMSTDEQKGEGIKLRGNRKKRAQREIINLLYFCMITP